MCVLSRDFPAGRTVNDFIQVGPEKTSYFLLSLFLPAFVLAHSHSIRPLGHTRSAQKSTLTRVLAQSSSPHGPPKTSSPLIASCCGSTRCQRCRGAARRKERAVPTAAQFDRLRLLAAIASVAQLSLTRCSPSPSQGRLSTQYYLPRRCCCAHEPRRASRYLLFPRPKFSAQLPCPMFDPRARRSFCLPRFCVGPISHGANMPNAHAVMA